MGQICSYFFKAPIDSNLDKRSDFSKQYASIDQKDGLESLSISGSRKRSSTSNNRTSTQNEERQSKRKKISDYKYLDYPILQDDFTGKYILKSKVMVIMRGLSGSGKSLIAELLAEKYKNDTKICCADKFFLQKDGTYVFDGDKLKESHNLCVKEAHDATSKGVSLVIIDNTNIKLWEFKKYLSIAKDNHYSVLIIEPQTHWAWDPIKLEEKSTHGLKSEFLQQKKKIYQPAKPIFFGWFLNPDDSALLVKKGWECLHKVMSLPKCQKSLLQYCVNTRPKILEDENGFANYYRQCGADGAFQSLHCTTKFTNRMKAEGSQEYVERKSVRESIGKAFPLLVTEFLITPRTIGVRVLLPDDMLDLWGAKDDFSEMSDEVKEIYDMIELHTDNTLGDVDISALQPKDVPEVEPKNVTLTDISVEKIKKLSGLGDRFDRFCPMNKTEGSRAHLTIGVGPDIRAVVTGFDALYAVQDEKNAQANVESFTRYEMSDGILIDYSEGKFVFYPDEPMEVTAFFGGKY